MSATAVGERETQRRSYPGIRGQYGTRGWELVRELDLAGNALWIAGEARALLTAPLCPALDATDLILGSEQMALQIHESVGHAVELDRILGWEAAFAGTLWLDPAQIGHTGHPGGGGPVPGRARRGQGVNEMDAKATSTDPLATAERVLDLVRDRASDAGPR